MYTTPLTAPPVGNVAHAQPSRETEKRETRPVEPPADSSTQQAGAKPVKQESQQRQEQDRRPEQEFVFPPAPGLLSLIMRAESARQAEREVRHAMQSPSHAVGTLDPPVNPAGQPTSQHAPGEVVDKYV